MWPIHLQIVNGGHTIKWSESATRSFAHLHENQQQPKEKNKLINFIDGIQFIV